MVWLHGGGYTGASGSYFLYDGTHLASKHDVVAVTLNHRLNVFGYLHLADLGGEKYADATNVGMLDIVAALRWVRDNISAFGGDPGNVTIFGQSGGAGKVSTLLAMPAAKGLFHRAIVESGSAVRGISREQATKSAEAYLARLGLKAGQVDVAANASSGSIGGGDGCGRSSASTGARGRRAHAAGERVRSGGSGDFRERSAADRLVETEVTFFAGTPLDPIWAARPCMRA